MAGRDRSSMESHQQKGWSSAKSSAKRDQQVLHRSRAPEVEVQLALAHQLSAEHQRRARRADASRSRDGADESGAQLGEIVDVAYVELDQIEAHDIAADRLDVCDTPRC